MAEPTRPEITISPEMAAVLAVVRDVADDQRRRLDKHTETEDEWHGHVVAGLSRLEREQAATRAEVTRLDHRLDAYADETAHRSRRAGTIAAAIVSGAVAVLSAWVTAGCPLPG